MHQPGEYLDQLAGPDRSREVHVSHLGGDAVTSAPPHGAGVRCLVDSLQDSTAADVLTAEEGHIRGRGKESKGDPAGTGAPMVWVVWAAADVLIPK